MSFVKIRLCVNRCRNIKYRPIEFILPPPHATGGPNFVLVKLVAASEREADLIKTTMQGECIMPASLWVISP